jgi:hypothetical protein
MKNHILVFGVLCFNFLFCTVSYGQRGGSIKKIQPLGIKTMHSQKVNNLKLKAITRLVCSGNVGKVQVDDGVSINQINYFMNKQNQRHNSYFPYK